MDAISFVLGVKSSQLRSSQLKELIYRGGRAASEGSESDDDTNMPKRAYVCAIYEKSDETILRFMRTYVQCYHELVVDNPSECEMRL